ncbi:unnamed protein product [Eruca vesicaria subsp. sativa]|uniref:Uncharacterized protein n=1 Tax=Eruca vesicaria subsp. sativa TaxID=29727 RepID=A0ABC8L8A1_ERUVS|nr:unnamed protein product [Eruca vesicaria subsp. sativa]
MVEDGVVMAGLKSDHGMQVTSYKGAWLMGESPERIIERNNCQGLCGGDGSHSRARKSLQFDEEINVVMSEDSIKETQQTLGEKVQDGEDGMKEDIETVDHDLHSSLDDASFGGGSTDTGL